MCVYFVSSSFPAATVVSSGCIVAISSIIIMVCNINSTSRIDMLISINTISECCDVLSIQYLVPISHTVLFYFKIYMHLSLPTSAFLNISSVLLNNIFLFSFLIDFKTAINTKPEIRKICKITCEGLNQALLRPIP